MRWLALPAALALALPAGAQACDVVSAGADGRAFNHMAYGDAPEAELVPAPDEVTVRPCLLRSEVMPDLIRLSAASGGQVLAISCHRSVAHQQEVFCRDGASAAVRAQSVAPPGFSEHATGYALDFAFRPRENGCPDIEGCVAGTAAFRWLVANGPRYGFEMSFPVGSRQQVKWEPWHWRWVGTNPRSPGAWRARRIFAQARRLYPAAPGMDVAVQVAAVRPVIYLSGVPTLKCRRGRCKVQRRRG